MATGKLVIIEGGEGTGKTTLIEALSARLQTAGVKVVTTREPGGTPFAEEVRGALVRKRNIPGDYPTPTAQLLGFYAARFDHLERVIIPALESGALVLCDRFELTSYAYQVHTLDPTLKNLFIVLHKAVCAKLNTYPLQYIICELDPVEGVKRALGRDDENTSFDEKNIDFHIKAHEGRQAAIEYISDCFAFNTIDASTSRETMVEEALKIIS